MNLKYIGHYVASDNLYETDLFNVAFDCKHIFVDVVTFVSMFRGKVLPKVGGS